MCFENLEEKSCYFCLGDSIESWHLGWALKGKVPQKEDISELFLPLV